ncbi:MAG: hypothetical protein IH985_08475 [Planctomycetes bacterium]|nr:hypothetical protein [Planctomycetota bacterium]
MALTATRSGIGLSLACAFVLAGCGMREHRAELGRLHAVGAYERAAELMDQPDIKSWYGKRDRLLWELDRGAIALALDDADTTFEVLESAEQAIERQFDESIGDTLSRWLLSDADTTYMPEPYEAVYVNVLKLLAHLEAGVIQGGATVEARRLSRKSDRLRELYVRQRDALDEKVPGVASDAARRGWINTNVGGEFIESTLGTYLTAVTFMESGQHEFQRVAGRRLEDSIALQGGLIGEVDAAAFAGLGSMDPDAADVLVVAFAGRGPTKHASRVGPIVIGTVPMYMELPVVDVVPSGVERVWVEVEGGPRHELAMVEDLARVAYENLERGMPVIYTRTFLRAAAKAGLTAAAAEAARRQASDSDQVWAQAIVALGGLVTMMVTERADLRSWIFLPGQARVVLVDLPEGQYRLRVVYEDWRGGTVYVTPWREIEVREHGLATIVEHYWD